MSILLFHLLFYITTFGGFYLLFQKAKIERAWRAFVPIWNLFIIRELNDKNKYWGIIQIIPFFGIFFTIVYTVAFVRLFGKIKWQEHLFTILLTPLALLYFAKDKQTKFLGIDFVKQQPKKAIRDFLYDAIYAIMLVYLVNIFILQSYVIPTPSMEDSLLVGDKLFVTKFNYGIRIPMTPLSLPLMHNTLLLTEQTPSYTELVQIPYMRWGTIDVERGDVMVFNFPMDDTSINLDGYRSLRTYYAECRLRGRETILANPQQYPLMYRPTDKKENFIKRAVGIAGDTIQVKNKQLIVNNKPINYPGEKYATVFTTNGSIPNTDLFFEETGVRWESLMINGSTCSGYLTKKQQERIKKLNFVTDLKAISDKWETSPILYNAVNFSGRCFPYDTTFFKWTKDEYGPIWIPKKGLSVVLNDSTINIYGRCIGIYEKQLLTKKGAQYYINGQASNTYTFKMNYYWLMGDNRDNSLDSRYWGFVPEDHVIGKAFVVWFASGQEGIRWNRFMQLIK